MASKPTSAKSSALVPKSPSSDSRHQSTLRPTLGLGSAYSSPQRQVPHPITGVGSRLHGASIRSVEQLDFPFLTWDAWMMLHHLSQPLERNRDGSLPSRWIRPHLDRMVPLPRWVGFSATPIDRVECVLHLLFDLELVCRRKGPSAQAPNYALAAAGQAMLSKGRAAFFAHVLGYRKLALDPSRDVLADNVGRRLELAFWNLGTAPDKFPCLGQQLSQRVLEVLPATGAVGMDAMLQAFAPAHPVGYDFALRRGERTLDLSTPELFDSISPEIATGILMSTLAFPCTFGLLAQGEDQHGSTWSFTAAGRRWLGLEPDPTPPPPHHAKLTPAYDLFFGHVDPSALAEVALYTERTGHDHGIVGRVSRTSLQNAMALGITSDEIKLSLANLLVDPIPPNVAIALDDWSRAAQPVRVREGIVLICSDGECATALERLARGTVERLGEAILLLPDRKTLTALRRKAGDAGIVF